MYLDDYFQKLMKHFLAHLSVHLIEHLHLLTPALASVFTHTTASATVVLILNFRLMIKKENFVC